MPHKINRIAEWNAIALKILCLKYKRGVSVAYPINAQVDVAKRIDATALLGHFDFIMEINKL